VYNISANLIALLHQNSSGKHVINQALSN